MLSAGDFVQLVGARVPKILIVTDVIDEDTVKCSERQADGSYGTARKYDISRLALLPPYEVSREELRAFCRFETDLIALAGMNLPENNACPQPYAMTPGDLLQALMNHQEAGSTAGSFAANWLLPLRTLFSAPLRIDRFFAPGFEDEEFYPLPVDEASAFRLVWNSLCETADSAFDIQADAVQVFRLADHIQSLRDPADEAGQTLTDRAFSDSARRAFVRYRDNNERLAASSEECLTLFRRFTEELCAENDPMGYTVKGYACYGGNAAYPEDWETARACMQKLLELDPGNAFPANTLGYIHYYGRCNGGVPQYEEAFRYFSIGAFAEIFESKYKVADMLLNGYGVPKNYEAARRLYTEVYNETLAQIVQGSWECKFADAALRVGNLYRDGIGVKRDAETAYRLYLQAEYAVRMRMNCCDYYGDATVLASVRKAKRELAEELSFRTTATVYKTDHPWLLQTTHPGDEYRLTAKEMPDGTVRLTAKKAEGKSFVVIPECDFCDLQSTFVMFAEGVKGMEFSRRDLVYTHIVHNDSNHRWVFMNRMEEVAWIRAAGFIVRVQKPKPADKLLEMVSVRFASGDREYDYLRNGLELAPGDRVLVPGNAGEEEAVVTAVFETDDPFLPEERYKAVLRKQSEEENK